MKKNILLLLVVFITTFSVSAQSRLDITIKDTIEYNKSYLKVAIANNTDIPLIIHNKAEIIGFDQFVYGPYTYMQIVGNSGEADCYITGRILFKNTTLDQSKMQYLPMRGHTSRYEEFPILGESAVVENPFPEDAEQKIRTLQLKLVTKYFDAKDEEFHNDTIYSNIIPWKAKLSK